MIFDFSLIESFISGKSVYKLSSGDFYEVDEFLKSDELSSGDIVVSYAGLGKVFGNKKTLEKDEYKLKYKEILFLTLRSYEVYERI